MKRIQKQLLTAGVLVFVGGGAGLYTLFEKVKTPETRLLELRESQRLFRFGRIHVQRGRLRSTTGTVAFERDETGRFRVLEPIEWVGNQQAFNSILDHMAGIALTRVLTDDATDAQLARAGLERPAVTLTVELDDGRQLTLHIGRKNKLVDRYPVTDAAKKRVGLIDPAGYWNYVRPINEFRSKQVFAVADDEVIEVHITGPDGDRRISLTRNDPDVPKWRVQGPHGPAEPADRATVGLFLVRITKHLDVDEYVTDSYDGSNAARYGLAPPSLRLEVRTPDQRFAATIGFASETGSDEATTIVHLDGTKTLVRNTDSTLKADLTKPARTFIDRTITRFDSLDANELVLRAAGQPVIRAERDGEEGWRLTAPEVTDAKPWKLDAIVRVLSFLRANRWHKDRADQRELEEWQLEPWSRRATILGKDGRPLGDVVFGKYADDKHIFVKAVGEPRVGLVAEEKLRVLPDRWQDLVP